MTRGNHLSISTTSCKAVCIMKLKDQMCCHFCRRYTSLDGRNGTRKNPALVVQETGEKGGGPRFLPAHMLSDGTLERAGRN